MADKFQSISSGLGILKNFYQGPIKDQLSEDLPIYRAAEKVKKGWNIYALQPFKKVNYYSVFAAASSGSFFHVNFVTMSQMLDS